MSRFRWITATLVVTLFTAVPASAQDEYLTMAYEITPKAGSVAGFEAALKAHMEFREANGDPWDWTFYQVMVGDKLGTYIARSGGHSWADFDEYFNTDFNEVAGPHWDATVQPLVESARNAIDQRNQGLSNVPEAGDEYSLFNVSTFYLKPDMQESFTEVLGEFHRVITEADLPFYYVMSMPAAGGDGPSMSIVGFAKSWSEFSEDPAVNQALLDEFGEEGTQELSRKFSAGFHYYENYVVMARPDLSSGGM